MFKCVGKRTMNLELERYHDGPTRVHQVLEVSYGWESTRQ